MKTAEGARSAPAPTLRRWSRRGSRGLVCENEVTVPLLTAVAFAARAVARVSAADVVAWIRRHGLGREPGELATGQGVGVPTEKDTSSIVAVGRA